MRHATARPGSTLHTECRSLSAVRGRHGAAVSVRGGDVGREFLPTLDKSRIWLSRRIDVLEYRPLTLTLTELSTLSRPLWKVESSSDTY